MKKILIVVAVSSSRPDNMNWLPLRDAIREQVGTGFVVDMTALTQLIFDIGNKDISVIDSSSGKDVSSYDLVVIRNVGKNADLGIALAHYLRAKGVLFTDSYLETRGSGKLACSMLRQKVGLPFPHTVYAPPKLLPEYVRNSTPFPYPFILKSDNGKKGRDNYLITDEVQLIRILGEHKDIRFIAQEYISNDGDIRALVLDGIIALVIGRTGAKGSHLSNTSQGGSAVLLSPSTFSPKVVEDILAAAEEEGLEVAGVDVIFDKRTGEHYILEVNRAPQIGTGAFVDEKIAAYTSMLINKLG